MNAPLSYSHKIIKVVFAKKSETAPTIPHFIKGIKNMKAKRVTAKILAALLLLESCGVPAFAELSLTEVSLGYSSDASESAETAWENDISSKGFRFELPESFGEQPDITETETTDLKDETDLPKMTFYKTLSSNGRTKIAERIYRRMRFCRMSCKPLKTILIRMKHNPAHKCSQRQYRAHR